MTDLTLSVRFDELDMDEVLEVLASHFGFGRMEPGEVRFWRGAAGVDVEVSRRGRIARIRLWPGVTSDEVDAIRNEVEDALVVNQTPTAAQYVGFCSRPVTNCYRYRGKFQILPVPNGAPLPNVKIADHPFLLQYWYNWSSHLSVSARRRLEQAQKYLRLLDLLSGTRIHGGPRYIQHAWVWPPMEEPDDRASRWAQLGYNYPGLTHEIQGLSDMAGCQPVRFVPAAYHFAHLGVTGESLALPDDVERALDLAFGLGAHDRKRLERALIYLGHAKSVWYESQSLSYVGHVMAIEALVDKPERCEVCRQAILQQGTRCRACSQAMFGTTRAFKEFLETHAPAIHDEPGVRNRLYALRSALAHGYEVMLRDLSPLTSIGWYSRQESELEATLQRISGAAIRSWLHSRQVEQPTVQPT